MLEGVLNKLGAVGKADAIVSVVDKAEGTETGQYALRLIKGSVTAVLIIVGLGIFFFIRSTNKLIGEQNNQIATARTVSLNERLFDYYNAKYPQKSDAEIRTLVNKVL